MKRIAHGHFAVTIQDLLRPHRFIVAAMLLGLTAALGISTSAWSAQPRPSTAHAAFLHWTGDYPLPGRATRWDYMSLDPARSRMFIAHLGDSSVVAIDTKTKAVVGTIRNIGEPHGILAIPELGRVYVSATKTNEVVAIDAETLRVIARIPGGKYPDGMAYAPEAHKLYVSDETGGTETVVDVRSNERVATIQLGGAVGNTQYDPGSKHVFVNVQGRGDLVEIDPSTDAVVRRTTLAGADGNHGLFIEPSRRLAFVACEGNDKLFVVDLSTHTTISRFKVGHDPDVLAYDAGLGLLYVASESGKVSQFKVGDQGVTKTGEGFVGPNAHVVAVDPSNHEVYFPLKETGRSPVLRIMQPAH
jgi:YVTN family beta-propeller protein